MAGGRGKVRSAPLRRGLDGSLFPSRINYAHRDDCRGCGSTVEWQESFRVPRERTRALGVEVCRKCETRLDDGSTDEARGLCNGGRTDRGGVVDGDGLMVNGR